MIRFLTGAALTVSMLAAVPATAQPYGSAQTYGSAQAYAGQGYGSDFWRGAPDDAWQRINWIEQRIQAGRADGSLTPQEARRAEWQLRQIRRDAMRMRRGSYMSASNSALLRSRLDALSRNIRWARQNGNGAYASQGYGNQGYGDSSRFVTQYDARRYYREGPQYSERRLSDADEVYRGSDGRYYCKRSDGTTGLIVGGAVGGLLGNVVDGGHNRVAGTLIGGALGALLGRSVEQNSDIRCR